MPAEREDFPIARVAALARLHLSPSEEALYEAQLSQILTFVGQVAAAAFDAPEASRTADCAPVVERSDKVGPSLPADAALANAPDTAGATGLIRVPKVLG